MNDWKPGDLAMCVIGTNWKRVKTGERAKIGPKRGQILVVERVALIKGNPDIPALGFASWPGAGFQITKFRKIKPLDTKEAVDDALVLETGGANG